MNQLTFSDMEYSNRKKKTKREEFLDAMEEIVPWSYWVEMISPYYFANKRGRKPIGVEIMLRMYLMQIWFNLSDEGIEDSMCTYGGSKSFKSMESIIEDKHDNLVGRFSCKGFDTFGPFKLIGGVAKGHPDDRDLAAAVEFYKKLIAGGVVNE